MGEGHGRVGSVWNAARREEGLDGGERTKPLSTPPSQPAAFSSENAPKSPWLSPPALTTTVIITSVPAPSPPSPGAGVTGTEAPPLPRTLLGTRKRLFITWAQRAWATRSLGRAGGGGAHCWPLRPASR